MKAHWFDTRAVSAAPLVFSLAVSLTFNLTLALFLSCGEGVAGCPALAGSRVQILAPLDTRPLLAAASAPAVPRAAAAPPATAAATGIERGAALKAVATRYERRYAWGFFAGLSGLLLLASFAAAAALAWVAPRTGRLRGGGRVLLVLLPAAAVALALWLQPGRHLYIIHPFLLGTIAADRELGMPAVPQVMNGLNALSTGSALAFALACWLLIQHPPAPRGPATPAEELEARLDEMKTTATYLRVILFVATASLVVGVLRLNATLSWMQAFLAPGDAANADGLRTTITTMIGAYYSLMLASLYLPAALIVRERARAAVAAAPVADAVKAQAYARPELSLALPNVLSRVAVLLGPLLAGPIGEFLKNAAS